MAGAAGMTWGIKDTLVSYVEELDDGSVEVHAPAVRTEGAFFFPWDETGAGRPGDTAGELRFQGGVRLTGYWGALDVELREPRVEWDGDAGTLLVRERAGGGWLRLATLELGAARADDDAVVREASAALTGVGALLLGGPYRPGTPLSPLTIALPGRP